MTEAVFANARIVLRDEMLDGHVQVKDGVIADIGTGAAPSGALDLEGDYLLPGVVELHTDHVEGHLSPRPKVSWNPLGALMAHDAQIAASGITTVFDCLRLWPEDQPSATASESLKVAQAIKVAEAADALRVEHFIHLRCEVATTSVVAEANAILDDHKVHLISLMDHTPGQRQFASIEQFRSYYMSKSGITSDEMDVIVAARIDSHERHARVNRARLVTLAHEHQCVLASHDDATPEHVAEAIGDGVTIAEFPTTLEAAKLSHEAGIRVLMGAPNLVRGGSHTGNASAEALARLGILDLLSSDYVPSSLLWSAFDLTRRVPDYTLPAALRLVTFNPAEAAGLTDRGQIALGKKADLLRVTTLDGLPVVRGVWRNGRRVS